MVDKVFLRSAYNYDRDAASLASGLLCDDESLTKQSFVEESDINTIVRRFGLSGQLPADVRIPRFEDFSEVYDFHSAMNAVAEARESFDAMPADVRSRFQNDPGAFVDFCLADANREEATRMGLVDAVKAKARAAAVAAPTVVPTQPEAIVESRRVRDVAPEEA